MITQIHKAIDYLESHGFLVRSYGLPEGETMSDSPTIADSYRVLQGDFDTGMIQPHQILEVAEQHKNHH